MIVGFVCNWGAYSGVEMAGARHAEYPASVRLLRVPCLGRLHAGNVLKAFELGADGVMLLACPPAECRYESGTKVKELFAQAQDLLHLLGIDRERLALLEVPVGKSETFVREVAAFIKRVGGQKERVV